MKQLSIASVQNEIGQKIGRKFGFKDGDLHYMLDKARGKLPRGFEKDLSYLFDADERTKHPKRRGQIDLRKLKSIRRSSLAKLDSIDLDRDTKRSHSLWLAEFASRMLLFAAGLVGLLYWFDII